MIAVSYQLRSCVRHIVSGHSDGLKGHVPAEVVNLDEQFSVAIGVHVVVSVHRKGINAQAVIADRIKVRNRRVIDR